MRSFLYVILAGLLASLLMFCGPGCFSSKGAVILESAEKFPRWLDDGKIFTDQTSGIVFIGRNKKSEKTFLLADDIGTVYHLTIKDGAGIRLNSVGFSPAVREFLDELPKKDFEDITFDPYTRKVYLSIEGNRAQFRKHVGVYELVFRDNDPFSSYIESIKKLNVQPDSVFTEKTARNLGFEGIAVDRDYFYFGLEGDNENVLFSGSAYIYIVDKQTLRIKKILNTKAQNIETICGLYAPGNHNLLGVDRNNKNFFCLSFDDSLNIKDAELTAVTTSIPGYPQYDYIAAIESITMDDENNIYMADDPWKAHYVPADFILQKLDLKTQNNFKRFVPILYKYKANVKF